MEAEVVEEVRGGWEKWMQIDLESDVREDFWVYLSKVEGRPTSFFNRERKWIKEDRVFGKQLISFFLKSLKQYQYNLLYMPLQNLFDSIFDVVSIALKTWYPEILLQLAFNRKVEKVKLLESNYFHTEIWLLIKRTW